MGATVIRVQLMGGRFDGEFANIASGEAPPEKQIIKTENGIEHIYELFTHFWVAPEFEYRFKEARDVNKSRNRNY